VEESSGSYYTEASSVSQMATDSHSTRPLRADARRNRDQLLDAANAAFAEAGTGVALEEIARRAGVGIGTLYRHFPTREALIEAAYRHELAQVAEAADVLLADARPGDVTLGAWMERFLDYAATKRGMGEAIRSIVAATPDLRGEAYGVLLGAIERLVAAGIADGSIRPDARADDVLRAMSAVWTIPEEQGWQDQAGRLFVLLLDGLRVR
jgi:AcrR family transcriptional regulator